MTRITAVVLVLAATLAAGAAAAAEITVDGVKISAPGDVRPAAHMSGKYQLVISIEGAAKPPELSVELPASGPNWWPAQDVVVRDRDGQLVPATHLGTEWHKFTFTADPDRGPYRIERLAETYGQPPVRYKPEAARTATDPASGLAVTICPWHDGRAAALCMRFDDSHPTHLTAAIPILDRHGFRATFMVNPGNPNFLDHKAEWEAVAKSGRHELANHTMHHRGATSDQDAEREIGDAAQYLAGLLPPGRSKLLALNLGGGTKWTVSKPLRYFLAKYHCFLVTGSMGMDDVYGHRVEALRRHIEANIKRGGWCKAHWHYIGPGLSTSLENFRAEMAVVEQYKDQLWICGLAEAYKYLTERRAAALELRAAGQGAWTLTVTCGTDPALFDYPLTIEVSGPAELLRRLKVVDSSGRPLALKPTKIDGRAAVMFDVPPRSAAYTLKAE